MRINAICLLQILLLLAASTVQAGPIGDVLGFGAKSGKLAKLEFRLRENSYVTSVAWSPDGRYIATAGIFSRYVHVWDVRKKEVIKTFEMKSANANSHTLSWSHNSEYLAVCGPAILHVYRSSDWSEAVAFDTDVAAGCVRSVFSSDDRQLAILAKYLKTFSVPAWSLLGTLDLWHGWPRANPINDIAYMPGTHTLVLGGAESQDVVIDGLTHHSALGRIWFLDAVQMVPTRKLQVYRPAGDHGGAGNVVWFAISPNGQQISTGALTDNGPEGHVVTESVHLISASDGALLGAPLDGVAGLGNERALAYTRDGRFVVVGHGNPGRCVQLIDARTAAVVDTLQAAGIVFDIAVNSAGSQFAAGSGNEVDVWSLPASR